MGIPGFFSWLLATYPDVKKELNPHDFQCDNLYLDMNQIIYMHAESNDKDKIIEETLDYIDQVVSTVKPRRLLYIAMDGVVPRARMNMQRTNRFIIAMEAGNDAQQTTVQERKKFDTCNIKPGTEFMSKLSQELKSHICRQMNATEAWKNIAVTLSDSNVPGEGEYKIMNFIRQQRQNDGYNKDTYHIVYSGDSDVILLGLAAHENNFRILIEVCGKCQRRGHTAKECKRETTAELSHESKSKFRLIDLSMLRTQILKELGMKSNRAIDDWVCICLLLGNDFLPPLPSTTDVWCCMETLLKVYIRVARIKDKHLTKKGKVDLDWLQRFFEELGREEKYLLVKQHEGYKTMYGKDPDENDQVRLWESGSHNRYYKIKLNVSSSNLEERRSEIAENYIRSLCWIFQYYYKGVPSWSWYYPHHYAPFASDLRNILVMTIEFDNNTKPFSPFEQMMAIFAPQDASFLPEQWGRLMARDDSSLKHYYPEKVEIDSNEKPKSQVIPNLPFVNENVLLQVLAPLNSTLTEEERERNRRDYDLLFVHAGNLYYKQLGTFSDKNDQNQVTEEHPKEISTAILTGFVWPNSMNDNIRCVKYCDKQSYQESIRWKTESSSDQLQAVSIQPSPDFTSRWTYSVQLILNSPEDNRLYSIFKKLTDEHLPSPISLDQCLSTLQLDTHVKQLVIEIAILSVDKRDDLIERCSSLEHIESIYLLGKPLETKEERLKFFQQYPKICMLCKDERKLALRWSLDTIEEYRTLGDQFVKQNNKDTARQFYQRGIILFDQINKLDF